MSTFAERLRTEIEYAGMLQKEVAHKAGIKKRALDMYLGSQASMPPADVAVRLAKVLNVSTEYLVTGEDEIPKYPCRPFRTILDDLSVLPDDVIDSVVVMVHTIAEHEKKRSIKHFSQPDIF